MAAARAFHCSPIRKRITREQGREYVQVSVTRKTGALAGGKIARACFFYQDGTKIRALVLGRRGSGPLVLVLKRILVADLFES